ncbi:MAG TPA: type II toxin-antitoxin system Phd/YefM family antitoxin [Burkholderiales bacterium]|nr:type II toxin-antitoxin system Phd/YefM family antitoxin [Burkholderiales bacterium]
MTKTYSISEAKDQLPRIVYEAEAGRAGALTRRGKPVAILPSKAEYERLRRRKRPIEWGAVEIDTRGFKFDRGETNAR